MGRHLRYLELYSGVGGWTMAIQKTTVNLNKVLSCSPTTKSDSTDHKSESFTVECVAAFDHSDICNQVFQHNFSTKNVRSTKIEKLTINDIVERYHADIWMMSPPCQPHTRQHTNQRNDINDSRSNSFLHLCNLLHDVFLYETSSTNDISLSRLLPSIIVLENVVGFETSNSCTIWIQTLLKCKYKIAQFHLQPTQIGIPNDRPRYYCVAILQDISENPTKNMNHSFERYFLHPQSDFRNDSSEAPTLPIHKSLEELGIVSESDIDLNNLPKLNTYLEPNLKDEMKNELMITETLLKRPASWCLDIVSPASQRTSCFTSSYGKYAKGTGSVLLLQNETIKTFDDASYSHIDKKCKLVLPELRQYDAEWAKDLLIDGNYLRYFSDVELVKIFGYIDSFTFPDDVKVKQRWRLIGNSLNVTLAAKLLEFAVLASSELYQV